MLPIDDIVRVVVNVNTANASSGTFDVGLILTPDENYTDSKRLMAFNSFEEAATGLISAGFAASSNVYMLASAYFGVEPAPTRLLVSCYPSAEGVAETPAEALVEVTQRTVGFYGVCVADGTMNATDKLSFDEAVRASSHPMMAFYAAPAPVSSAISENSALARMYAIGTKRAVHLYCNNLKHIGALMGKAMGLAHANQTGSFQLCYQSLEGVTPYAVSATEYASLQALNCNVYTLRGRNHQVLEKGATSSGMRFDEVLYIDTIVDEIQNSLINMITGSSEKLPQTDSTTAMFISECNRVLEQYYNRGILATQNWRGVRIGNVEYGDTIEHGYICMADSFNNQSDSDRAAHKAMPITILLCLSGSVESIVVSLNVQQ